jgi:hypothetical protein
MFFSIFMVDVFDGTKLVQSPFSGTFEVVFKEELVESMNIFLKHLLGIAQRHSRNLAS